MRKYDSLATYLDGLGEKAVILTFDQVGLVVGGLPSSARKYREWWANDSTHVQAKAWMGAGWCTADVDLGRGSVQFQRSKDHALEHRGTKAGPRGRALETSPLRAEGGVRRLAGNLAGTLLLLPCSKAKAPPDVRDGEGRSILDDLPSSLARPLAEARNANRQRARVDERRLLPAWRRYEGALYGAAGQAIGSAVAAGHHILIVSGGYGLIRADEPIGWYDAVFNPRWWPEGLLQECLVTYVTSKSLRSVVAFAGRTTNYAVLARTTTWSGVGLEDAHLISPERGPGAQRRVPRTIGEALEALLAGELDPAWTGSDGTQLRYENLL